MNLPSNEFLKSLSPRDFELLGPHLRDVGLPHAKVLFEPGDVIEEMYFPNTGVVSFVVPLLEGGVIEAGMLGRDGVVGAPAALDGAKSLNRAIVQVPGEGLAISVVDAKAACAASSTLRAKLYQHDQLLLAQAQQSAACNASHQIEERLCRWLLRTRDVAGTDDVQLTQEFMAQMLGVRRSSLTMAARHLQAAGLIKYRRGRVRIIDAPGLEEISCECYQAVKRQHEMLAAE